MTETVDSFDQLGQLKGLRQDPPSRSKNTGKKPAKKRGQRSNQHNKPVHVDNAEQLLLSRNVSLTCSPVIATLQVMQDRPDIAVLLNEPKLPKRLSVYLKKLNVISANGELTELGEQLRETKQLPTVERGLYHIWYCHSDPLIAKRPVVIQRVDAFAQNTKLDGYRILHKKDDNQRKQYTCAEQFSCKLYNSESKQLDEITAQILDIEVVCEQLNSSPVVLSWQLSGDNSNISINGQLAIKQLSKNNNNKALNTECSLAISYAAQAEHSKQLMQAVAEQFHGQWSNKNKQLQLPFYANGLIDNYEVLDQFKLSRLPVSELVTQTLGTFHVEKVNQLAVQPLAGTEINWQKAWTEHFYERGHVTPIEADKAQQRWLQHPAVIEYDLAPMCQHDILQLLQEHGRKNAYWNAAASIDLVPTQGKDAALPLHLTEDEYFDFAELVRYLTGEKPIKRMIISDRYYKTNAQHDLLHEIAYNVRCSDSVLYTSNNRDNQSPPPGWHLKYFKHMRPENHDRYWLFITTTGTHAWKLSTGLDFARQIAGDWQVVGLPSFTPITESDLPKYLQELLVGTAEEATV